MIAVVTVLHSGEGEVWRGTFNLQLAVYEIMSIVIFSNPGNIWSQVYISNVFIGMSKPQSKRNWTTE